MVELEDEVIIIAKLEIIDGSHEHDLGNGKLLNPTLVLLDAQQIAIGVGLLTFLRLHRLIGIYIVSLILKDCLNILMLF